MGLTAPPPVLGFRYTKAVERYAGHLETMTTATSGVRRAEVSQRLDKAHAALTPLQRAILKEVHQHGRTLLWVAQHTRQTPQDLERLYLAAVGALADHYDAARAAEQQET